MFKNLRELCTVYNIVKRVTFKIMYFYYYIYTELQVNLFNINLQMFLEVI